ncbi:hypothetical protein [Nonomuraea ceibae]|uniref:hypothetical protein n=1 Tax=Nonomuraea ceibae TaxID=1935170 RepID=UPI001C5E3890|nr:hypothetical protein [Nonomuraea ceibae]
MGLQKVTYAGETMEIDLQRLPIHEGIALQRATGMGAVALGEGLKAGDFIAMAGFAWLILHFRMGKDITYSDICDGTFPVDFREFEIEAADEPDPHSAGAPSA